MKTSLSVLIAIGILALFWVPYAVIWSLNTLFDLSIAYTLKTWAAILMLALVFGGGSSTIK